MDCYILNMIDKGHFNWDPEGDRRGKFRPNILFFFADPSTHVIFFADSALTYFYFFMWPPPLQIFSCHPSPPSLHIFSTGPPHIFSDTYQALWDPGYETYWELFHLRPPHISFPGPPPHVFFFFHDSPEPQFFFTGMPPTYFIFRGDPPSHMFILLVSPLPSSGSQME